MKTDRTIKKSPKTKSRKKPLTMYEQTFPNKATGEAMSAADRGEVTYYESVSAFFKNRKS